MGANIPDREQPGPFAKGPYSRIKWAREDCKGKLKPLATAVYCYIAERAGPGKSGKDFKCTASVKTMAEDLNISRRTVQDLIHSLHWTGWLQASWKGEGRAKRFEWAVVSEHDLFVADDRFHDPKLTPGDVLRREKRWEKRKKVAAAASKVAAAASKVAAAASKVAAAAPDQEGEVEGELQGEVKVEPLASARPVARWGDRATCWRSSSRPGPHPPCGWRVTEMPGWTRAGIWSARSTWTDLAPICGW